MSDGGAKAVDVKRQHVALKKDALQGLKEEAGVADFKAGKNVAGTRATCWLDGRFLQGTITLTRKLNDERPDVDCGGEGGLAAPRSAMVPSVIIGMCDGSVRYLNPNVPFRTLQALATSIGGEVIANDY